MRTLAIALMATAISLPAAGAMAQNNNTSANPANQPSQTQSQQQPQANNNQDQNANQQQAQNQPIQPQDLSRGEVRQVQTALNKQGHNVGRVDGHWGPKTKHALNQFQQSKGIQGNGQLTHQTVADLGLNANQFNQQGNQNQQGSQNNGS